MASVTTRHGHTKKRTGRTFSATYSSWNNMLYRRGGLSSGMVVERWLTFENFLADMGEKPGEESYLARHDETLPYGPGNCYWKRKGVTFNGRTLTIKEWAAEMGLQPPTLSARIRNWGLERALSEPQTPRSKRAKVN